MCDRLPRMSTFPFYTMSKLKTILSTLFILLILGAAWLLIPTHTRLGSEIVNKPVGESLEFKGYKLLSTEPKEGKLHHYFLVGTGQDVKDVEPFLVTSDPFAKITFVTDDKLQLQVKGRVTLLNNDLWIENSDGTVNHWLISAQIQHTRAH